MAKAQTVTLTGRQFKEFYNDEQVWGQDGYHEDDEILINGVLHDDNSVPYQDVADTDVICIKGGCIIRDDGDNQIDMVNAAKKWAEANQFTEIIVKCDKSRLEELHALLNSTGFSVVNG